MNKVNLTREGVLVIFAGILDSLQFAELSFVRQGVKARPDWWADANALAMGGLGLLVAFTFALAIHAWQAATPSRLRTVLIFSTAGMFTSFGLALTVGLLGISGWPLVVPSVASQLLIYLCLPLSSAVVRQAAPATRQQILDMTDTVDDLGRKLALLEASKSAHGGVLVHTEQQPDVLPHKSPPCAARECTEAYQMLPDETKIAFTQRVWLLTPNPDYRKVGKLIGVSHTTVSNRLAAFRKSA